MLKESGYTVKGACEALGISRSSYYVSLKELERLDPENGDRDKVQEVRDERLLERIKSIKASHPFWGYRRITAWLRGAWVVGSSEGSSGEADVSEEQAQGGEASSVLGH